MKIIHLIIRAKNHAIKVPVKLLVSDFETVEKVAHDYIRSHPVWIKKMFSTT